MAPHRIGRSAHRIGRSHSVTTLCCKIVISVEKVGYCNVASTCSTARLLRNLSFDSRLCLSDDRNVAFL